jgi:hypothetical protein
MRAIEPVVALPEATVQLQFGCMDMSCGTPLISHPAQKYFVASSFAQKVSGSAARCRRPVAFSASAVFAILG